MTYYIIPARKGSKRFPEKNKKLFPIIVNHLDDDILKNTIVSTNDDDIIYMADYYDLKIHRRSEHLCDDDANIRDVLWQIATDYNMIDDDILVLMYLTYPERTGQDIKRALNHFEMRRANSLLCQKEIKTRAYLIGEKLPDGRGKMFYHNLYRSQDSPDIFEVCHFICISKVCELNYLSPNMYNNETVFYPVGDVIDVDTEEDLIRYENMLIHSS